MAIGRPDWTSITLIKGLDAEENLLTVLVDESRALVAVMKGYDGTELQTLAVDGQGRMISVIRDPTSDNYIAVDGEGQIIAVMKGDYAGTLQTLAVDTKGRIQAVLTDPEDVFGNPNYLGAGELAARLGSINTFERRGQVFWMDDFESSTFKWNKTVSGITIYRSIESALMNTFSVKFDLGTAVANHGEIDRHFHAPTDTRIGVECAFALHNDNVQYATMSIGIFDGEELHISGLDFRPEGNNMHLGYRLGGISIASPAPFATIDIPEGDQIYTRMKLVIDTETKYNVRAIINNKEYDLSAYEMFHLSIPATPEMIVGFHADHGAAVAATYCYLDNFIVTQNEP